MKNIFPSWKAFSAVFFLVFFRLNILSSSDRTDASSNYTNLKELPLMFCKKQSLLAGHLLVNSAASQGNRWLPQSGNSLKMHLGTIALWSHQQQRARLSEMPVGQGVGRTIVTSIRVKKSVGEIQRYQVNQLWFPLSHLSNDFGTKILYRGCSNTNWLLASKLSSPMTFYYQECFQ